MNQCAKACGDQADTADGFHAVQSDRNSVDGIGAAALTIGKGPLHQEAHHQAVFTRHQLTVKFGVGMDSMTTPLSWVMPPGLNTRA